MDPPQATTEEPAEEEQGSVHRGLYRQVSTDDASCRICFEGTEAGILFKPCLCGGTMKYIHVECLNRWRLSGIRRSEYECPNCKYKYNLRKIRASGWLNQFWVVPVLAMFLVSLALLSCCGVVALIFYSVTGGIGSALYYGAALFGIVGFIVSLITDPAVRGCGVLIFILYLENEISISFGDGVQFFFALAIVFGILRAVYGTYQLLIRYATGTRDRLRDYVADIRDVVGDV